MRAFRNASRLVATCGAALLAALPGAAQSPELAMLGSLERGSWEIRERGGNERQRLCVRNGRELIQLRHRQPGCSQLIVQDEADEVTVQYTCRGNGYGRTTIRRESNVLVQISSQGLLNGAPFSLDGEGRRVGSC
jgi:hypothetical protein